MQCRYGLGCRNPNCLFLHPGQEAAPSFETSKIPCVHYKKGRCIKGADCKFLHDDSQTRSPMSNVWIAPSPKPEPSPVPMQIEEPLPMQAEESLPEEQDLSFEDGEDESSGTSVEEICLPPEKPGPEQLLEDEDEDMQEDGEQEDGKHTPAQTLPLETEPPTVTEAPFVEPVEKRELETVLAAPEASLPPAEPECLSSPTPEPQPPTPVSKLTSEAQTPQRILNLSGRSPKPAVEAKATPDTPKIIPLPSSKLSAQRQDPGKGNTTKMARQQKPMTEIKIKTLEEIKREKEELRGKGADKSPGSPQGSAVVTQMQRVTRVPTKSKPSDSPCEPLPSKKPKTADSPPPSLPEAPQTPPVPEDPKPQQSLTPSDSGDAISKEINDLIYEESRNVGETGAEELADSMLVYREEPGEVAACPPPEPSTDPVPMQAPALSPAPFVPVQMHSPVPATEDREINADSMIEAGEIVETAPPPPLSVVLSKSIVLVDPPPAETMAEVQSPSSAPVLETPPPLPPIRAKVKPQTVTAPPQTPTKTVISLPSTNKHSAAPGEILTLEEIKRRKQLKELSSQAEKPTPAAQPSPMLPPAGVKRAREVEVGKEPEPVKRVKPVQPPRHYHTETLGDWEPLAVALRMLDFTDVKDTSDEEVSSMKELASRMATPSGFLELLDEFEEKVSELEVSKGLAPDLAPEFLV